MENITIADIAKVAQVSIATVSNVLNNKGNVKITTIRKVEHAVKELGYVKNENAQIMKRKESNTIIFVLPLLTNSISPLVIDLLHNLKIHSLELKIIETNNFNNLENLKNLFKQNQYRAVICLRSIKNDTLLNAIPPSKLIMIGENDYSKNTIQIDISPFFQIEKEIEKYTMITDESSFSISELINERLANNLNTISITNTEIPSCFNHIKNRNFIVFSLDMIENLMSYYDVSGEKQPHFILFSCKESFQLYEKLNVRTYYFSSNELSLKIIDKILNVAKENDIDSSVKVYLTEKVKFSPLKPHNKIKLLLLDNPFAKAIQKLAVKFTSETGIDIDITSTHFDSLNELIHSDRINEYDMIKLDVGYFPWLGPKLFQDLSSIPEIRELANQMTQWDEYSFVDKKLLSLPADPSIQMMLYRKDIFENPIIQKAYSDQTSSQLLPPSSYADLASFCEFYQSITIPEKNIPFPISLNNSSGVLLASEFLPYFYSQGGEIKLNNNLFEVTPDIFIETLNTYKKIFENAKLESEAWWDSEIESFNNNDTAIIISYTNHLNQISGVEYNYSPIPGQMPAFGGGVLGITKSSTHLKECTSFYQWLYQYNIQKQLATLGVCIPNMPLFDLRDIYRKYPFLSYSGHNFSNGKRLQKLNDSYIIHTIALERIIGEEILKGIKNNLPNLDILIKIINQLNARKDEITRKYE